MIVTEAMYNELKEAVDKMKTEDINDLQGNMKLMAEQIAILKKDLADIKKSVEFIESFNDDDLLFVEGDKNET